MPTDCIRLLNVEHNMGADGNTPGSPITIVDRTYLTKVVPAWMTTTGAAVRHYIHDQRDQIHWYAFPRPIGDWYVNALYAAVPPVIAAGSINSALISIGDEYQSYIHDYIVGYALAKTFKTGDIQKAAFWLQKAYRFIDKQFNVQELTAPLDQPASESAPNALGKP